MSRSIAVIVMAALLTMGAVDVHAEACSITSVTAVAFESYNVFDAAPVLSAGSVAYECTGVQASDTVTIELTGATDSTTLRALTFGSHALHYQLYLDAARTIVWGTGTGGTATYGPLRPADGAPTSVPVYGRVPARQDVAGGQYADTVIVTLQL